MDYLYKFVSIFFDLLNFLVVIRVLMSWFPQVHNKITYFVRDVTEPLFRATRFIPKIGMFDISPIVILFALDFIKSLILTIISNIPV